MYIVLIELITSFIQYFAILVSVPDITFPDSWKEPFNFLNVINLHFDFLREYIPELNDVRLYFMGVSVVAPLVFIFLGLVFLNPKLVVLWYFMMVAGCMLLVGGALGRIITEVTNIQITASTAEMMMYIGGGLVVACILLYIFRTRMTCCMKESKALTREQVIEEETKNIDVPALIQRILMIAIFVAFFFTWSYLVPWLAADRYVSFTNFWLVMGYICLGFAAITLIWLIMGLTLCGRRIQWKLGQWCESAFLRVLLVTLSLAYIPIGSGVFLVFNCNTFSCPDGFRLPDEGSAVMWNTTLNRFCTTCTPAPFASQMCPMDLYNSLCVETSDSRLEYDVSITCDSMIAFFWPAAILITVMFVLGAPILFQQLIKKGSVLLDEEFPLLIDAQTEMKRKAEEAKAEAAAAAGGANPQTPVVVTGPDGAPPGSPASPASPQEGEQAPPVMDEDERWNKKVIQSQNVAKFLYQPFSKRYRYVRLVQLIQKLIIVAATVYVYRNEVVPPAYVAIIASLAVHFLATIALLWHKPFIMGFESKIAIFMSVCLTISTVIGLLLLIGVEIDTTLMLVIIILNGVLPLIALIIGIVLEYSQGKREEEEQERIRLERMKEEIRKEEEEEAKMMASYNNQNAMMPDETVRSQGHGDSPVTVPIEGVEEHPHIVPMNTQNGHQTQHFHDQHQQHQKYAPAHNGNGIHSANSSATSVNGYVVQGQPHHQQHHQHHASNGMYFAGDGRGIKPITKSQKQLKKQKRAEDAKRQVQEEIERERKLLAEKQGDIDMRIDKLVKESLNRFLMGGGLLGFIALGLCIVGLLVDGSIDEPAERTVDQDFAGYNQWSNFTQHCCCVPYQNPNGAVYEVIEKWVCDNGRIKERLRAHNGTSFGGVYRSGLAIRGLCEINFNLGCTANAQYTTVNLQTAPYQQFGIQCPSGVDPNTLYLA